MFDSILQEEPYDTDHIVQPPNRPHPRQSFGAAASMVSIEAVASAFPQNSYTQADVQRLIGVEHPVVKRLLKAPHIQTRNLMLDAKPDSPDAMPVETVTELNKRFHQGIQTIGLDAARKALIAADVNPADVGAIVAVTSSGLPLPGISAILIRDLGISCSAHRADLVGMGCNAGVSGLRTISQMIASRPAGTVGLLVCVEVSSALYVRNETVETGIVNSLFGDGAAAVVVRSKGTQSLQTSHPKQTVSTNRNSAQTTPRDKTLKVQLKDFESSTFPELFDDMRYDVDADQQRYKFLLSKRIPAAVGKAVVEPVTTLLKRAGLHTADVDHWVVHSGGAAVIEGVTKNLNLFKKSLRHTVSVLRDYGNLSSASVLVSFERLLTEQKAQGHIIYPGDIVVMMGMGPGATIEVALGSFAETAAAEQADE